MKRILAFCLTLMFSVCLSGNLVYASINNNTLTEENLNNYSIEQLLEYAREQGINYTIIDYKLIDKSELIDVILALTSTPEIVEEEIVYTDKNSMDALGLGESYEYNVNSTKRYTTKFNNKYTCSIDIKLVYNLYTTPSKKYIDKVITKSSKLASGIVNNSSYKQYDIYIAEQTESSVLIKGHGLYSVNSVGINFDKDIFFDKWFYAGDR